MPAIEWINFNELGIGRGHPTLQDVINRPLRQLLENSSIDPDGDDPSISTLGGKFVSIAPFVDITGVLSGSLGLEAAIAEANVGGTVYFPPGAIVRDDLGILMNVAFQRWIFGPGAKILKAHIGDSVEVAASNFEADYLRIEAAVAEDTAFGTTGRGLYFTGASDDCTLIRPVVLSCDKGIIWAADAGKRCSLVVPHCEPHTLTAGSEGTVIGVEGPDTQAMQREVVGGNGSGVVDVRGALDMTFSGGSFRRPLMDDDSFAVRFLGTLFGSLGQPMTFDGASVTVQSCRCAGNIIIAATFTGSFIGNPQTSGTFVDNSTFPAAMVIHQPLSVNYCLVFKHKILNGSTTGGAIQTGRRNSVGDAAYVWDPQGGVDQVIFGTALTAPRAVTANLSNLIEGIGCTFVRNAAATGASAIDVLGVVSLTAAKQWARIRPNGSGGVELVSYGTFP